MKTASLGHQLQKDLALLLLKRLYNKEIGFKKAQAIAKFILKTIPERSTDKQLEAIIPKLDDNFPELAPIVIKYLKSPDKEKTNKELEKVRSNIKTIKDKT